MLTHLHTAEQANAPKYLYLEIKQSHLDLLDHPFCLGAFVNPVCRAAEEAFPPTVRCSMCGGLPVAAPSQLSLRNGHYPLPAIASELIHACIHLSQRPWLRTHWREVFTPFSFSTILGGEEDQINPIWREQFDKWVWRKWGYDGPREKR